MRSRRGRSRSSDRYRSRSRGDRSRSADRYRSRRDRSRRDRSRSSDRYRSRRQRTRFPARQGGRGDRSRSRDRRPSSPDRSRSGEKGRLARRDQQEGGETVAVSQAPAVSEASTGVTPAAGGTPLSTLPSAVQDLARFFLNLSGVVGGVAGVTASTAGSGVQLCPSTSAGGAVALGAATAILAGAGDLPAAPAAVPGVSGQQQRQEDSRSRRRRRRSSSDGTDRRSKKRNRRRSPSPLPSSRRRERHYRASSSSSEEDRADASPPRAGRAPGGTPGDSRSS